MKAARLLVALGVSIASTGAFAEIGVNIGDVGYVAAVYGRTGVVNVKIAGPLITRPGDVAVAGREPAKGLTEAVVKSKHVDVNEVFGRA